MNNATATNRYGERVKLHGPVCVECHQRIAGGYVATPKGNYCQHCCNAMPAAQFVGMANVDGEAFAVYTGVQL